MTGDESGAKPRLISNVKREKQMDKLKLMKTANEVRKDIVTAGGTAQRRGHPGGSLSAADIFTYLYFEELNIDPKIEESRQRPFRTFQGSYGAGTLLCSG